MRRCQNCNLPEGKFNVVLNDSGICNYCQYFEQNKGDILNIANREQILARRFQNLKGKYEYDAIVGLSGGKDSTYVLYQMVKKHRLLTRQIKNGKRPGYHEKTILFIKDRKRVYRFLLVPH